MTVSNKENKWGIKAVESGGRGGLATRAIRANARKAALTFETRAGIRCTLFYFPALFSYAGRHLKISQPYLYKEVPLRTVRYTNYSYSYVLTGDRCHCIQFVANVSFMKQITCSVLLRSLPPEKKTHQ